MTTTLENSTRPVIRFDDHDVDRSTARRYANDLISRVNKPGTNDVLTKVAEGEAVDAYDLAEALLDAQRHIATRFGQSMQRRREGEKAAHLGYIAHSVLKAHADGLPTYEPGARSPRIKELEIEVEHAGVVNQTLTGDLTFEREQRRAADAEIRDLRAKLSAAEAQVSSLAEDLTRHAALREYVESYLLDAESRAAVAGFTHGWVSATRS